MAQDSGSGDYKQTATGTCCESEIEGDGVESGRAGKRGLLAPTTANGRTDRCAPGRQGSRAGLVPDRGVGARFSPTPLGGRALRAQRHAAQEAGSR